MVWRRWQARLPTRGNKISFDHGPYDLKHGPAEVSGYEKMKKPTHMKTHSSHLMVIRGFMTSVSMWVV